MIHANVMRGAGMKPWAEVYRQLPVEGFRFFQPSPNTWYSGNIGKGVMLELALPPTRMQTFVKLEGETLEVTADCDPRPYVILAAHIDDYRPPHSHTRYDASGTAASMGSQRMRPRGGESTRDFMIRVRRAHVALELAWTMEEHVAEHVAGWDRISPLLTAVEVHLGVTDVLLDQAGSAEDHVLRWLSIAATALRGGPSL